ncbi:MAG: lysylphosphatidylglycerol synthase transmembrane domain-containing protein [Anaerolineae bacterium]
MQRHSFWKAVGLVALIGIIAAAFAYFVDLQAVAVQLRLADPRALLAASTLLIAGLAAYAVRWRLILSSQPTFWLTFHASNIGHAGNIIIPARAGEAARIVVMGRSDAVSVAQATSSFVVERLFEQIMRLVALGGAVAFGAGLHLTAVSVIGGVGIVLLAFLAIIWLAKHQDAVLRKGPSWLARFPRISEDRARESLADLLASLTAIASPRRLAAVLLWSFTTWACFWGFFYLALLALPGNFAPEVWLPISLGALALSPPTAPTQPGIFHASVVAPLAAVGFAAENLTAYAVILHILEMALMIGLALWGVVGTGLRSGALLNHSRS